MPIRLSKQGIARIRAGLIRSWQPGGSHRTRQQATNADADTVRSRALFDRKGKFIGSFDIYHSTNRVDQFDVYAGGKKVFTGGARMLGDFLSDPVVFSATM